MSERAQPVACDLPHLIIVTPRPKLLASNRAGTGPATKECRVDESDGMEEIVAEFLVESREGLDRIEGHLVTLEDAPHDLHIISEIFRVLHTLKGTCSYLGLPKLESVAHRAETVLSTIRDSDHEMTTEMADVLLATMDTIRLILESLERSGTEGESDVGAFIEELERVTLATKPQRRSTDLPPIAAPEARGRLGDLLVSAGAAERSDIERALAKQKAGDGRTLGDILVDEGKTRQESVNEAIGKQRSEESSIRVDVSLLDSLMNMVGELVLCRNQIQRQLSDGNASNLQAPAQRLNSITTELQNAVMKTRLQPIGRVWNKLPRLVRDLSRQCGKNVRIEMHGAETEVDRTILEALKDPLTHMVRNTIGHGIETGPERMALGKEPEGLLRLTASHQGGKVQIDVSDDGAGMDVDKIRTTAVERGIVTKDEVDELTDNEVVHLIFAPGFSTASSVNNLSGRGVGMDVVRINIERIGGEVDITTGRGQGTTFTIRIPLTLAIIPALIVCCGPNRYAIPQVSLLELVHLEPVSAENPTEEVCGAPVYRHRGHLLPIVDLRLEFGLPPTAEGAARQLAVLVCDGREFGLVIDVVESTEEIVVKPLGRSLKDNQLFSGATILGDGSVALIIDVVGLAVATNVVRTSLARSESRLKAASVDPELTEDLTLIVLGLGDGARIALRLSGVDRLEELPVGSIEQSRQRDVVQYRGGVLPIIDLGPATGLGASALVSGQTMSVAVHTYEGRSIGLAAARFLDIVANPSVVRATDGTIESAIIDGQVTDLIDAFQIMEASRPMLVPVGAGLIS